MTGREADEQAIREVARAYMESWLEGDGERMRGALHPMLAKRGLDYDANLSPKGVHHLDAEYMVGSAARGPRPQYSRAFEITNIDLGDHIASVRIDSEPFVDLLHLAQLNGSWSIVNALYEDRDPAA